MDWLNLYSRMSDYTELKEVELLKEGCIEHVQNNSLKEALKLNSSLKIKDLSKWFFMNYY